MILSIYNEQQDLPLSVKSVERMVLFLLDVLSISTDEIIIHFVTKKKISQIHQDFFDDPSPTDCITFPIDSPNDEPTGHSILGELFVCPKIAIEYGKKHQIDPYEETSRYVIHSLLHLIGYDDLTPDEYTQMHAKENSCVELLIQNKMFIERIT